MPVAATAVHIDDVIASIREWMPAAIALTSTGVALITSGIYTIMQRDAAGTTLLYKVNTFLGGGKTYRGKEAVWAGGIRITVGVIMILFPTVSIVAYLIFVT